LSATYDLILEAPDWVGVDPLSSRNPTTIGWMEGRTSVPLPQ